MRHEAEKSEKYERMIKMTTYSIGWAVITLICIVSVVLISKELGQKEKELADERNKITDDLHEVF